MPKSIEILRGRFPMPRAGFNQHKLMPGPSCFGLHISSRNKSAEPPRAAQGLLGLEVAGTGWGWLWEPPGLRAWGRGCSEPTPSSVPRSWCQLCNAAPAWSGCASANNPNTQTMQMDSVGTKAFLLPGLGRAWRDPPGANQPRGEHRGRAGASSCTAQHAPGIPWQ